MNKKKNLIRFGEKVAGYDMPVLNEREIRAAAGILFLVMFVSLVLILFQRNFLLIRYVIIGFFSDFSIRVLINPQYSPTLVIGRLIVSRQEPEYVGAAQKKFAWTIGLCLSGVMFILLVVLNTYSLVTSFICLLCLTFLFFETAFGICLGCLLYPVFFKKQRILCSGAQCKEKQAASLQLISRGQLLCLLAYVLLFLFFVYLFNDHFRQMPRSLWDVVRF